MTKYLLAILIIGLLLMAWVVVQRLTRLFAVRHPELGPYREAGAGCGGHCGCSAGHCQKEPES